MTTRTTFHLFITRRDLIAARARAYLAQRDPLALLAVLILVPIIVLAFSTTITRSRATPTAVATPPLPIIIIATAQPQPMPAPIQVAAVPPNTFSRAVVAYDAPNGNPLGAIEQGRAYRVLARYGADWLQADVVGSGVVWLKSADVFDLPSGLADLAPPVAPAVVYMSAPQAPVAQPAAPAEAAPTPAQPIYHTANEPLTERQQNIQDRMVDPSEVQRAWAAEQWREEHQVGDRVWP